MGKSPITFFQFRKRIFAELLHAARPVRDRNKQRTRDNSVETKNSHHFAPLRSFDNNHYCSSSQETTVFTADYRVLLRIQVDIKIRSQIVLRHCGLH